MQRLVFKPGVRVAAKRKIKPHRDNGNTAIPQYARGTVTYASKYLLAVRFDDPAIEVRIAPGDLIPLSLDERFALEVEYWKEIADAS